MSLGATVRSGGQEPTGRSSRRTIEASGKGRRTLRGRDAGPHDGQDDGAGDARRDALGAAHCAPFPKADDGSGHQAYRSADNTLGDRLEARALQVHEVPLQPATRPARARRGLQARPRCARAARKCAPDPP